MIYADTSKEKVTVFTLIIAALVVLLLATFLILSRLPRRDYSLGFGLKKTSLMLQSLMYQIGYDGGKDAFGNPTVLGATAFLWDKSQKIVPEDTTEVQDIPVLVYHGIVKKPDQFSLTQDAFWNQMLTLKKNGYETVTLQQFEDFMKGTYKPKGKVFLLTFDDGRTDSYYGADPILKALDYTAVMFVATQSSFHKDNNFRTYYLDETLLRGMVRSKRWDIGSHAVQKTGGFIPIDSKNTQGNFLSNKIWLSNEGRLETDDEYKERIKYELTASKIELEERLKIPITALSYPFSDFGEQSINNKDTAQEIISEFIQQNYQYAFQQASNRDARYISNYTNTDPYHLRRIEVPTDWSGTELTQYLELSHNKMLPYTDSLDTNRGWKYSWGDLSFKDGFMNVTAKEDTTGAFTFLDGTRLWNNYRYTLFGSWTKGSHISLIGKFNNGNNYVACTFSDKWVRAEEFVNGKVRLLADDLISPHPSHAKTNLGITVQNDSISCSVDGQEIIEGKLSGGNFPSGGIGIKVWDENNNIAALSVDSISVESL